MAQEEQALLALINETLTYATRAEHDFLDCIMTPSQIDDEPDEEREDAESRLKFYVAKLFMDLRILAERLGLPQTRQEIDYFQKSQKDLAAHENGPEDYDVRIPSLNRARQYLASLEALVNPEQSSQLSLFKTILQHTAKIIVDAGLTPSKETEVRNKVLQVTNYAFVDAIKEVVMPQSVKSYQGDIGIPSIRAVAEYKFAKNVQEMKQCLDGIYSDMKAYDGHDQWRHFFAVFYMAGPFYTQAHIEKEFKNVGAAANWTPIVINGPASTN